MSNDKDKPSEDRASNPGKTSNPRKPSNPGKPADEDVPTREEDPSAEHGPPSEDPSDPHANELARTQEFDTPKPVELDVSNNLGPVDIEFTDTASTRVEIRYDSGSEALAWRSGLTGLLSWVGEQLAENAGRAGADRANADKDRGRGARTPIADAIDQTRVDLTGNRLVARTPSTAPLRTVPLSIGVRVPEQSHVGVRTGSGAVNLSGQASRVQIQSGAGEISVDRASAPTTVRTGSGQLRLGEMTAGVQVRSGSGDVEIASLESSSSIVTGSGGVWIGALHSDVLVRSGSGDLDVADATRGRAELITGSGAIRVAVHRGVRAEVDLTSSTGTAHSDLEVSSEPLEEEAGLRVYGRTGNGDARITSAL